MKKLFSEWHSLFFKNIPAQLSKHAASFKIESAVGRTAANTETIIADMADSMVINIAYHTSDPQVGMGLSKDPQKYKLFLNDTGLFITLAFSDKQQTENEIYKKLLSDKLSANLGYVYENLTAQMLRAAGNELYYYTFPDGNKHNYEIDFILARGDKIIPIEVKSSGYKTHTSLDLFCQKFRSHIGKKILLYTKDFQKENDLYYLPIYFAGME